jgi:hypothetical protein
VHGGLEGKVCQFEPFGLLIPHTDMSSTTRVHPSLFHDFLSTNVLNGFIFDVDEGAEGKVSSL